MAGRDAAIIAFLARHGWAGAARTEIAGDASFRRYERLADDGRRAVLMDAPPGREDVRPFVAVARYLAGRGYSAPAVYAADAEAGLVLLEDLGDGLYTRLLDDGAAEAPLYAAAIDLLIDLHRDRPPAIDAPPFDDAQMQREVALFLDWYLPEVAEEPPGDAARDAFREAWTAALPAARAVPEALVLFDYHAPNLMWLPGRDGVRRVGLLDFQDARVGPVAYDVVSLLEDARRDVADATAHAMIDRYLAGRPEIDRDAFAAAYAVMGAQRNVRILGTFTRLWRRDGKAWYRDFVPRVWRHLEGDLAHPALAAVRHWLDGALPPDRRTRPK